MPFAILLVWGAHPTPFSLIAGGLTVFLGEALRIWAAVHIGPHSRGTSLRAPRLVTSGPYGKIRHPLYLGNMIVCGGLLVLTRSFPGWFPAMFGLLFLIQYALFIRREESYLSAGWGSEWRDWREGRAAGRLRPFVTGEALRLEWPTLRTLLGLLLLIGFRARFLPH